MKIKISFLISFLISISAFAARGGDVGNGGDTVFCNPSDSSKLSGYYNLDYLLTQLSAPENRIFPVKNLENSLFRIQNILAQHSAELAHSFLQFQKYIDNHDNYLSPQLWSPARYGLISISDEQMIKLLPANCLTQGSSTEPKIIQTVIRRYEGPLLKYYYDSEIFSKLSPEQLSFLYVHEWLWSFTMNPETIRNINSFLHSEQVTQQSHSNFLAMLGSFGLNFHVPAPKPLCAMNPSLRMNVEVATAANCENFEAWDSIQQINLLNTAMIEVPYGEFGLFPQLREVNLSSNQINFLFPMTFKGNGRLNMLQMVNNNLKEIPDQFFKGLYSFENLIMNANKIESIKPDTFSDQKKLSARLEDNNLTVLDLGTLNVVPQLYSDSRIDLYLKGNKIQKIIWTPPTSSTILRSSYSIHLDQAQAQEVDLKAFLAQLKTTNGIVRISLSDTKLKDLLKEQGLSCVVYTNGFGSFECRNR